jgi:hypothetical protein
MKKLVSLILAAMLVLSFGVISVSAAPKLNATSYTLTKGYQVTLKVSGNSGAVRWGSSDTSVATVSGGKVVGKKVGKATISAVVDGYTLQTNLSVVDTKITADKSSVTVNKGSYTTVTLTVTGDKTGMTLSSANSLIAKGSWSGAKWDGNKITFRVTGVAPGTTSVTVYRKNYRSSYYKTFSVTVPGASTPAPQAPAATDNAISASTKNVSLNAGGTTPVTIYYPLPANLIAYSDNSRIATASASAYSASRTSRPFTITGLSEGTTTITFYDRALQTKYVEVDVTVKASSYFTISTTRPTASSTDQVVTFQKNRTNYYMLVPYSYDEAVVNNAIAKYFKAYDYYTVYSDYPTVKASGDTVQSFYANTDNNTTSGYPTGYPFYPTYPTTPSYQPTSNVRYILVPRNYDTVQYDTAVAKYNNEYDYYTIYNARPTVTASGDTISTWSVVDSTGVTITRYVLLPRNYDTDRLDELKAEDLDENQSFSYYKVLDKFPTEPGSGNQIFQFYKDGKARYMIVPRTNCDFVARNDAVYKDTGVYCYFNAYSTEPKVENSSKETVYLLTVQSGTRTKRVYILVDKTDRDFEDKISQAQNGEYFFVEQGDFANTTYNY